MAVPWVEDYNRVLPSLFYSAVFSTCDIEQQFDYCHANTDALRGLIWTQDVILA